MKHATLTRYLAPATVVYLAVPVGLFFGGWMRGPLAIISLALLVVAVWRYGGLSADEGAGVEHRIAVGALLLGLLPVVLLVCLSGAGGWGYQDTFDWMRHNATMHDLMTRSWPVVYDLKSGPLLLVSYVAYYLPAAAVGKLIGWTSANQVLFLTSLVGTVLAYLWVVVLTRAHPLLCGFLFVGFSGMDAVGHWIVDGLSSDSSMQWNHIEWWADFGQYSSNATLLFWSPQQGIPGWLTTALALHAVRKQYLHQVGLFIIFLSSLWSPFVSVGIIPLIAGVLLLHHRGSRFGLHDAMTLWNATGIVLGGILFFYYLARFAPYPLPEDVLALPQGELGLSLSHEAVLRHYFLFVTLEFLILHALLLYVRLGSDEPDEGGKALGYAFSFLLFVPLFRYGHYNDLVMRSSIPALFVTLVLVGRALHARRRRWHEQPAMVVLAGVLLVGSVTAGVEVRRHVRHLYQRDAFFQMPAEQDVPTLIEMQENESYDDYNFVGQFVGSVDSFFANHLARRSLGGEQFRCSHASAEEE